jgi:hypothetical protein
MPLVIVLFGLKGAIINQISDIPFWNNYLENIPIELARASAKLAIGSIIDDQLRSLFSKVFVSSLPSAISASPVIYWFNEYLEHQNEELTLTNIWYFFIAISTIYTE